MCMKCDGATSHQIITRTMKTIEEHGWAVFGIESNPGFAYTVGLTFHRVPELHIAGLDVDHATRILNTLARRQVDSGLPFEAGQATTPVDGMALRLDKLWNLKDLVMVRKLFGDNKPARPTALTVVTQEMDS